MDGLRVHSPLARSLSPSYGCPSSKVNARVPRQHWLTISYSTLAAVHDDCRIINIYGRTRLVAIGHIADNYTSAVE